MATFNNFDFYFISTCSESPVDFIAGNRDSLAATNRIALAKLRSRVNILGFSISSNNLYMLMEATKSQVDDYMRTYADLTYDYVCQERKDQHPLRIKMKAEKIEATTGLALTDALRRRISTLVTKPTRDGIKAMPYDYPWSSAPLYFRGSKSIPVWWVSKRGDVVQPSYARDLTENALSILAQGQKITFPQNWKMCNGIILPSNYVDTASVEHIFNSHNTFRCYLARNSK